MLKYVVAAFIACGALLGVAADAAPPSPALVQTPAASGDPAPLQRVWYYGYGYRRPYYGYGYRRPYGYGYGYRRGCD